MSEIFLSSNIDEHTDSYLNVCIPETKFFLYERKFSKRKGLIKLTARSVLILMIKYVKIIF